MMHLIHSAVLPFFSGVTIPLVFLSLILLLPVLAVVYSLIDFNRARRAAKLKDKSVGWRDFGRELLNNDYLVIWCFLAGGGMVIFAGFMLFLNASNMAFVVVNIALILLGGLLVNYGQRKLRKS